MPGKETIRKVIDLLAERAGWEEKSLNEKYLQRIVSQAIGDEDEQQWLKRLIDEEALLFDLIGRLAVSESWFFRDAHSFEYLIHYISQKKKRPFRLLSVGCSRGEEPYSMAMALFDAGLGAKDFVIEAIDVSDEAIASAKEGIFSARSFRGEERPFRFKHFEEQDGKLVLSQEVKDTVHFHVGNIVAPPKEVMLYSYDVIFCRNLLIYLHGQAQKEVVSALNHRLRPDGVLVVSPSETAMIHRLGYNPVKYPKACAFLKEVASLPIELPAQEEVVEENLLEKASRLADLGDLEEAEKACHEYLESHEASAQCYFVMGLIHHAMEDEQGAEELMRKAIYLEPEHYEALVYLALLAEKAEEHEKAEQYKERAERALKKE